MNGRHRIFAIAAAILGLAGGLAAGVVPASAATHAEANRYLETEHCAEHNRRFTVEARSAVDSHLPAPGARQWSFDHEELKTVDSRKINRKINCVARF